MNSGDWSNAADMWRIFMQKSAINNAWFFDSDKSLFYKCNKYKHRKIYNLFFIISLQTWYIICLTRANKHFEAQYQLNKWATSLGLHSSEEEEDFLNRKQQKDIQIWLDAKMQVSMENQLSVGDMKNTDVLLEKKEQEAVIWLLSEYRILRSWVEGEQGKDRNSLQQARQASKILEGYALFQEKQDNVHLDDTNVLQDIQNTENQPINPNFRTAISQDR